MHRVPLETAEKVLALYQERYFDLNVRHFCEKLRDEHNIQLSYTWVYQALVGGTGTEAEKASAAPAPAAAAGFAGNAAAYRWQ